MRVKQNYKVGLLAVWLVCFSGCALFNPHPGPSLVSLEKEFQNETNTRIAVSNAIMYATSVWDAYNTAVKQHSSANISGGLVTTALAASAVGAGAAGASRDLVLGLGSGAAGSYAATTLLVSRPRQYVYLAGMDAINCAIAVARPFELSQTEFATLESARAVNVSSLRTECAEATVAWNRLQRALEAYNSEYRGLSNRIQGFAYKDQDGDVVTNSYSEIRLRLRADEAWLKEVHGQTLGETNDWGKVKEDIAALIAKAGDYGKRLDTIGSQLKVAEEASWEAESVFTRLGAALTNGAGIVSSAPGVANDADALLGKCRAAAGQLIQKVNEIRAEVSRQVLRTEPDLTAIANQMGIVLPKLNSVTSAGPTVASQAPPKQAPAGAVPEVGESKNESRGTTDLQFAKSEIEKIRFRLDKIGEWIMELEQRSITLRGLVEDLKIQEKDALKRVKSIEEENTRIQNAISPIRSLIERVNTQIGNLSFSDCVVRNQAGGISVFPSSPIAVLIGSEFQIWVQGGKPPYDISWPVASDLQNITHTTKIVDAEDSTKRFVIDVQIRTNAFSGSRVLVIKDMAGFEKAVVIDVCSPSPN
jgi:hypothetical protein